MTKKRVLSFLLAFLVGVIGIFPTNVKNAVAEDDISSSALTIQERLELAEELLIGDYVDKYGYLLDEYADTLSETEISEKGLEPLIRPLNWEEIIAATPSLMAAAGEVTYYEKIQDSHGLLGAKFKVDGIWAFCANASKDSPPKGTEIESITEVSNKKLKKVLYYGCIGPGRTKVSAANRLKDDEDGWIQTSQAVSLARGNGTVNSRYEDWYNKIIEKDAPPSGFHVYVAKPTDSSLQPLAYFVYEPVGKCTLKKSSSDSATASNSNYSLAGAVYGVYSNKACTKRVGKLTTIADGSSNVLEVEPGTYYVKEITAPKGFALDDTVYPVPVEEDETYPLKVKDTPIKGKLQLIKSSSNPELTDGNDDYSLEGAVYGVYSDKACTTEVGRLTTTANGTSNVLSLLAGTYYVKEITAPKGFALDDTVYTRKITADSSVTVKLNVEDVPTRGNIQLMKSSSNPELTDGNDCYSLEGAVYGVYSDKACTTEVGRLTTTADGSSNILEVEAGTYYVKELEASKGYLLDEAVYEVVATAGSMKTLEVKEVPDDDPIAILLGKVDKETNDNKPENSLSLEGAEFTIKFFAGDYEENVNPEELGVAATRTWVFATDEDGFIYFNNDYKVSGDDFYYDSLGIVTMPMGTITIQETKAPDGYQVNNEIFVRKITSDGRTSVETYNAPTIPEVPVKITVVKEQAGTSTRIPGTEFVHVLPDGTKETVVTDENGELSIYATTGGLHSIYEKTPSEGYQSNDSIAEFEVTPNVIQWEMEFVNTDSIDKNKIKLSKDEDGNGIATFYDEVCPYKVVINKFNNSGTILDGVEFALYGDEALTDVIATKVVFNGTLTFENLEAFKTYYIKETKVPEGYKLPEDGGLYKIYADSRPAENRFDFYINDVLYTVENDDISKDVFITGTKAERVATLKIVNEIGYLLPETGSNGEYVLCLVGLLLMVLSMAAFKGKFVKE